MTAAVALEADITALTMNAGMAGFPDAQTFALVEVPQAAPLFLLRSLDQPGLEFVVVPPGAFFPAYAPEIDDASADRLQLTDAADALLLIVLTVGDSLATSTANLLAPIVINQRTRQAAQVVLQEEHPLRAPLAG